MQKPNFLLSKIVDLKDLAYASLVFNQLTKPNIYASWVSYHMEKSEVFPSATSLLYLVGLEEFLDEQEPDASTPFLSHQGQLNSRGYFRLVAESSFPSASGFFYLYKKCEADPSCSVSCPFDDSQFYKCGVSKTPGYSWIDIRARVHEFHAGDSLHHHLVIIYQLVNEEMKREGYIPNTNCIYSLSKELYLANINAQFTLA
ncbi:hypothetical protein SADUNF_Sadunf18G0110600 [Salix dunnii]|uniref:Uncharacterized protein n=1 Tax=Salix dunnii TaxID=1413687 RepID=A0A835MMM9_9ROSI|nr:hypothetical protein SADUNF_Sadunf18G0110600 [Salix dunnii]